MNVDRSRAIAIVGASIAGAGAAEAVRRAGYDGRVDLFDAQPHLPYDRPPLSKAAMADCFEPDSLQLKTREEWDALDVRLHLSTPVRCVQPDTMTLTLGGVRRRYDGIVLTPGCQPVPIPFAVEPGVDPHVVRMRDDADRLRAELTSAGSVVIVGGGFIGLELACAVRSRGIDCVIVEATALPLEGALGPQVAAQVVARHERAGTRFVVGHGVVAARRSPDGRVDVVLDDDRCIRADLLVVSIGVRPTVEFLEGSGIGVDNGIRTDAYGHTSAPYVVAAGDAANSDSLLYRRAMRVEHWTTAREQAVNAATNLVAVLGGKPQESFRHVPYLWTDQLDMKVQAVGRRLPGATSSLRHQDEFSAVVTHELDGIVVGAATINRPRDAMLLRQSIAVQLGRCADQLKQAPPRCGRADQ